MPNSHHLREVLLHYFISKKTAAESHRIRVKVYGEHALSERTCRDWLKFEDAESQALLDDDSTQTLKQLAKATRELFPDA